MITRNLPLGRLITILVLAVSFGACDSSPSSVDTGSDGAAQLSMVLADELGMTAVQRTSVEETAARHGSADAGEPGWLWYLAKDLAESLSDEQIAQLLERADALARRLRQNGMAGPFGPHPEGFGAAAFHGRRPGLGEIGAAPGFGHGPEGEPLGEILTDEQREALHVLRAEWVEQIREAAHAIRTSEDREAAVQELRDLLDEMHAAIDAWLDENLTEQQLAQIEAFRAERLAEREARREAVRAAIDAVLGEDAADGLEAIHDAFAAAVEAARDEHEIGSDEFHAAVLEAAATRDAAIEALLGEEGYLIFRIHQALQIRAANMHAKGFGQGGPQGHGNGVRAGGQGGPGGPNSAGGPGGNGSAIHQAS